MKIIQVKLSSIVYFFCFIGCSIQIYQITCVYLEYKVRHEVTYDFADQVELPTVDIIIPMVMSINLTELFIRYPEQMKSLCKEVNLNNVNYTIENFSQCSHGVKKVTVLASYILAGFINLKDVKELTIDPREQIDYIQIGNSDFTTDKCKMTRYFSALAVFLRIHCTEKAALITENMNIIGSYEGNIATIGHSLGSYFGIRFTSQVDMPVYELSKYFMVTSRPNELTSTWVRYEKKVSHSLPNPYETNCRYYNKMKVLHNCVLNYALHKGILIRSVINEWDSLPDYMVFDKHGLINADPLIYECAQRIPFPECDKTTYFINGEIRSELVDTNLSGLIFIPQPVTPIMYYNVHPDLLLSEYLIFVGSIVGTWFGYSIFDRLISMLTWIKSKVNAKIRKGRERESSVKIFTIRNSDNFSNPLLHSTPYSAAR
uniref:Uncharacterized protein n=1 Tax=Tetranychus urticae TaxID=32264 RepID=T1K3Y5_TETUR